jgi:predicted DNA-binding transcriptional regulator AlpA
MHMDVGSKKAVDSSARPRRQGRAAIWKDMAAEQSRLAVQIGAAETGPVRNLSLQPPGTERLERLFRIDEIAKMGGPKRAKLYEHIRVGLLPTVKIGSMRRVTESGYRQYLASLAAQSQSQTT